MVLVHLEVAFELVFLALEVVNLVVQVVYLLFGLVFESEGRVHVQTLFS